VAYFSYTNTILNPLPFEAALAQGPIV